MNNPAGKLQIAQDLLDHGMLCKCDNWVVVPAYSLEDADDMDQEVLQHDNKCEAVKKYLELLNG